MKSSPFGRILATIYVDSLPQRLMIRKAMMRDWRDASTLVLIAKTSAAAVSCTCGHDTSHKNLESPLAFHTIFFDQDAQRYNYVDAKSHLLNQDNNGGVDFQILMLTRSSKSKFMPNALVFPGGVVDHSDKSPEWHDLFQRVMGVDMPPPPTSTQIPLQNRPPIFSPPMFTPDESQSTDAADMDLALRICAIRETFEEIGILLVRNSHGKKHVLSKEEVASWRRFVHKNAENFRRLCEDIEMVPDVWSLYEWSNWLTPTKLNAQSPLKNGKRATRRFDTMFYVTMLDQIPAANSYSEDDAEIVKAQWLNPFQALNLHYEALAWMAPPQIYEQARLMRFSNFDAIRRFSAARQEFSLTRWLPVALQAEDGIASLLPGDSAYPVDPAFDFNHDEPPVFSGTLEDLRNRTTNHHRFEMRSAADASLICNAEAANNHVKPLSVIRSKVVERDDV